MKADWIKKNRPATNGTLVSRANRTEHMWGTFVLRRGLLLREDLLLPMPEIRL